MVTGSLPLSVSHPIGTWEGDAEPLTHIPALFPIFFIFGKSGLGDPVGPLICPISSRIEKGEILEFGRFLHRVIRFVLHVLQLLLIRFELQNLCCIIKSMMKHQQKLGLQSNLLSFSYGYGYQQCMSGDF